MSPNIFKMAAESAGVGVVKLDAEFRRIEALPRRSWQRQVDATAMTRRYRKRFGAMKLRPVQAAALTDIEGTGGLFAPMRVGAGKTLVGFLAPAAVGAERPLLLVPAALLGKTRSDYDELSQHWKLPPMPKLCSYEWLGRVQAADMLEDYKPDLIAADEVHRLKNLSAAVTRRVKRYMREHPSTAFVAMSGTITKRSIKDYAHIMGWTHQPSKAPLPSSYEALELWADALDERKGQLRRADPGALRALCNDEEERLWETEPRTAARRAFRRRLTETPGVVATYETPIDASILVRAATPDAPAAVEKAFAQLRRSWETPDGWPIADTLAMFQHARQLALGFYYVWEPRPPRDWVEARKAWTAYVRAVLARSRSLDSELEVRLWVERDKPSDGSALLGDWLAVKGSFEPNTEPRWIDDFAIDMCLQWAREHRGIVWVEHTCFGRRLQERGLTYYGAKGVDAKGRAIKTHPVDEPLAASMASNRTGRNLQAWSTNLIASMPPNGLQVEQLMGRTHRDGQLADSVSFDVLVTCAEHVGAFWQAVRDCRYVEDSTGSPQKILLADKVFPAPGSLALFEGHRWSKPKYK